MLRRKTTPRVKDGQVQTKNRRGVTAPDGYTQSASLQIVRRAPGPRQVHVVDEHDVRRFLDLLPEWPLLGAGIHAIVLDNDDGDFDGCYRHDGVIFLASWPEEIVRELGVAYHEAHREVFDRIGVPFDIVHEPAAPEEPGPPHAHTPPPRDPEPFARCWFEPATARDYLLMHVFLHELGHHHDRRTLRRGRGGRGEDYAEAWAIDRERELWPRYRAAFGRGR
jgi:hypothetical protein